MQFNNGRFLDALAASNSTFSSGTAVISGGTNVTVGVSGNTILISGAAGGGIAASIGGNSTSVGSGYQLISTGTMLIAGGNNITLSQNGNNITISGANAGGAQTGISGIIGSDATFTSGSVYFSGNGNITIGSSIDGASQYVRISAGGGAQSTQPVAASASNGSFLFSTIKFVEGSGITWATQAGGIQGSVKTDYQSSNAGYLTNQSTQPVAASASNGSFLFSTLKFVEGSGVTWATQANGIQASVKTDYQSSNVGYLTNQTAQPVAISGSNGSFLFSTVTLGNSNGLSFYSTNGSIVGSYTVPSQTVQPVAASASNGSFLFSTIKFVEGSGITWATQAGGIQGSVKTDYQSSNAGYLTNQSVQPVAISGSNGSFLFSTVTFGNLNNISFYTTNGSMVASQIGGGADGYNQAGFAGSTANSTMNLVWAGNSGGSGNLTFGLTGSTVTGSALGQTVQPVAASASNGSYNFSTIKFVEGSGVTWATQAGGIQASVKTDYQNILTMHIFDNEANSSTLMSSGQGSFIIAPLNAPNGILPGNISVSTLFLDCSFNSDTNMSAARTISLNMGLYIQSASHTLSLVNSWSTSLTNAANANASSSWQGARFVSFAASQFSGGAMNLTQEKYWIGYCLSSAGSTMGMSVIGERIGGSVGRFGTAGVGTGASVNTRHWSPFCGTYGTATVSAPASIHMTDINASGGIFRPHIIMVDGSISAQW